ncbi:MAG: T9SS type A sorting domain-containing protein [Ferruginibacter sp.]
MRTLKTKTAFKGFAKRMNLLPMTVIMLLSFIALVATATPISGTKTVGSGGNYSNLTTAFADINANGLSGTLTLQLITGYPATAETYPLQVPNALATSNFAVTIYPTVGGLSITSSNTTGTLNFNGSKNITIDGRVNMTGFTSSLNIANTSIGASYAIQFINDANSCTVNRCNIKSRNNSTTSGTIVFGTTTGANGNDNNTIQSCNISDDGSGSYPVNAIYSVGTTTTASQNNSDNLINANLIFNFFSPTQATNAILIGNGNTSWSIYNNNFYQTATRTYTAGNTHTIININCPAGYGFDIASNVIGGSSEGALGSPYTITGNVPSIFRGVILNVSPLAFSWISTTRISNMVFSTTSASFNNPGIFAGIAVMEGMVNVGAEVAGFGNTIGATTGTGSITINELTNFSARVMGIYNGSSTTVNIKNNNVGSFSTGNISGQIIYGIVSSGAGNCDIISNTIGSTTTANSITSGRTTNGTPSEIRAIYVDGTSPVLNINSNTIKNCTIASGTVGFASSFVGIFCNTTLYNSAVNVNSNIISDIKGNTQDGALQGIFFSGGDNSMADNNQIFNIGFPANSGSSNTQINGFFDYGTFGATNAPVTNNQVYNLYINGASTNTDSYITGMAIYDGLGRSVSGNQVHDLTYTNTSTGAATLTGISLTSPDVRVFKNKIYNLTATNGALSTVNGIRLSFYFAKIYNNLVSGLSAPAASPVAPAPAVIGLYASNGDSLSAYNNSFNLSGAGGANFGSAAVYLSSQVPSVSLVNNIFSNNCTASGTGKTVGLQWETATQTNYKNTSDNNLFYAGTPGANNLIFYDGTNADQTINAFKTRMATRDQSSVTENPNFLSTTGSNVNFLHINTTTTTLLEGGGTPVAIVTDDYDGDGRNADSPDIGADEFSGIGIARIKINSVSITPNGNQCTTTSRTVTANITAGANTITSVNLIYSFDGGTAVVVPMTGGTTTAGSTSVWTGTIPASVPGNALVMWFVQAQDVLSIKTKNGASYKDEPLNGAIINATASASPICSGSSSNLSVTMSKVNATVGDGSTTLGNTASGGYSPFGQYYEGEHTQYLVTAADLSASGLSAGNLTSLAFNITQKASTFPYSGYTIKLASTNATDLSGGISTGTFTQVYQSATAVGTGYNSVAGINTFAFGTGAGSSANFNWDGSSNLLVDICYANDPLNTGTYWSSSDVVSATAKSYTAVYSIWADNSDYCGVTTGSASGSSVNLPVIIFTGNTTIAPSAYSWSDGTGVIGTSNPLSVSPTTTTTYTVSATDPASNCPGTATVTVTVNHVTGNLTGGAVYCSDAVDPTTLSIAVTGVGPWNGTLSDGTPFSGTTSPISVSVTPASTTTYTITSLTDGTCTATPADLSGSATVTVNPLPATPVINAGGATTFCSGGSIVLTSSSASGNQWNLNGAAIGGETNQTLTVNASGDYSVTVGNGNCSATSAITTVTVNPAPATPTISANGPTTFCNGGSVVLTSSVATGNQWNLEGSPIGGETNQNLTVTAGGNYSVTVSNGTCSATSLVTVVAVNNSLTTPAVSIVQPTCAVATATVTVTTPTGTGISYSLDSGTPQSAVTFNGVASGSHTLLAQNTSGCSSSVIINVDAQPTTPTAPIVNGITNICPYVGTSTQLTYTANAPGATSYSWSLPVGVNLVSGAGTSSIVVTFPDPSIINQNYKQIKVRATSACGTSSQAIFYLLTQFPVTPSAITASSNDVCAVIGTSNTITYTIPRANSAVSYLWVAQQGTTIINHPNGTGINDTTVTVSFADNFTTSAITVTAVNDCGLSGTRSFTIVKGTPSTPSLISGPTNACSYVTPGTPATYTVAPVVGASAYNWNVPANVIGLSGQGTNTISFTYPQGFTNATISVAASNGCGTSAARSLSITTLTPSTPGVIDVINTVTCPNRQYTYSIASYPLNANSLLWTVPTAAGAVLVSGQNTASITVSYPSTQVTGSVTVQALNSCANSGVRSVNVKLPACAQSATFAKGATKTNSIVTTATVNSDEMNVSVSPNPTVNEFKLQVITAGKEKIAVNILDLQGRLHKQLTVSPYQTINLGADLKPGIYMIETRQGKQVKTTKLIKF